MFSTNQLEYVKSLLPTYAKAGYKYYVAYTNTNTGGGYFDSTTNPDLYVIFSKKSISAENAYSFITQDASILVTVRCGNYSSGSSAVNTDRIVVTDFNNKTVHIDKYEHIYTNAEFSGKTLQPDYYLISGGKTNVGLESICFVLLVTLILSLFRSLFRIGR